MRSDLKMLLFQVLPAFLRRRIMAGRYERQVRGLGEAELPQLRNLVNPGELALDVGCNLGVYTYELSRLTGRVIAFEPNPALAKLVGSLRLPGVEVRRMALSSEDGEAELLIPTEGGGHGLASLRADAVAGARVEKVVVPTRRLDGLNPGRVSFIKIDVEGFEEDVLDGAAETIRRDLPKLLIEIEERHNPGGLDRIRRRLEGLGYSGSFFHENGWRPIAGFDPWVHQRLGGEPEDDTNAAPRGEYCYINNFLFVCGEEPGFRVDRCWFTGGRGRP